MISYVGVVAPHEGKTKQKGGEEMSLEAIQTITESEQGAKQQAVLDDKKRTRGLIQPQVKNGFKP